MLVCLVLAPLFVASGAIWLLAKILFFLVSLQREKSRERQIEVCIADSGRRTFLKALTSGIVFPLAGCSFYGAYIGKERLEISKKNLFFQDLPQDMDGFTIAQISDIHAGPFMDGYKLAGFVKNINDLAPDAVVITGDIINWGTQYIEESVRCLSDIQAPSGVFAVLGNHDFYCNVDRLCSRLERAGIQVLRNSWRSISGNSVQARQPIYLLGIDDPRGSWYLNRNFRMLKKSLEGVPEGSFKVLLSHRPNIFDCAARQGVQLTLAGHTHGGQVIFPGPNGHGPSLARLAYERDYGLYREGSSYLYINKGLGVVGPPIRLNCPREISRIVLRKKV
jgi:hypothetical protein